MNCNSTELMVITAAKQLKNNKSAFVGTGLPMLASLFAQKTHAPDLIMIFEAGGVGPQLPILPVSVGDSRTFYNAVSASSMHEVMALAQAGYMDYGFLGGAQIDMYGNLNTTVIGDHAKPKARLPGSGGGNDLGSYCWENMIIMQQDKRKFVEKLDFITTPGYLDGPGSREKYGLPKDSGPSRIVTQFGVYGFDAATKKMMIISLHPGITVEMVQENSSFPIMVPDKVATTPLPLDSELEILRELDQFNATRK